jgi:starch synthase
VRVLFVASEVAPYAKTGGLGDVAGVLPAQLESIGHEVMVVTPLHRQTVDAGHDPRPVWEDLQLEIGRRSIRYGARLSEDGRTWFIDCPELYFRGSIYTNDADEHLRFIVMSRAAIELAQKRQWAPDIVHANDWQAAFLPLLMRSSYAWDELLTSARSVLTIHNLGYQGVFDSDIAPDLGLGDSLYLLHQEQLRAGRINFLLHGIMYADAITTVSPTYAREIQTPEMGVGLDAFLRRRASDLVGILNGVDTTVWNPRTDQHLPWRYSEKSLWRKEKNKEELLGRLGLTYEKGCAVVGIVSRLAGQKGIELIPGPLARVLAAGRARFVALGSGERRLENGLARLAGAFPETASFRSGYDERLAHLIEGGSDIFVMPSLYEPSGLNQMYSLAYGTVPVVRKTGGLADTVRHYSPETGEGTGFLFEHYTEQGLSWALNEALHTHSQPKSFARLQQNGMAEDNSWERRILEYSSLYERLASEERE